MDGGRLFWISYPEECFEYFSFLNSVKSKLIKSIVWTFLLHAYYTDRSYIYLYYIDRDLF